MKFIKKIKKLTKSWGHRRRIGRARAPQYLHGVACATHYCVRRAALIVAAAAMRCLRDGERGDKSNTVGVASWSARGGCVIASPMACSVVLRRLSCMACAVVPVLVSCCGVLVLAVVVSSGVLVLAVGPVLAASVLAGSHAAPLVLAALLRRAGAGRLAAPLGTVPGGSFALLARLPCWPRWPTCCRRPRWPSSRVQQSRRRKGPRGNKYRTRARCRRKKFFYPFGVTWAEKRAVPAQGRKPC